MEGSVLIEVDDEENLNKQIEANPKTLALFYASWCPLCRSFMSTFNRQAEKDKSVFFMKVRIDEDENPLWETYSLDSVPSIILFENGQVLRRLDCERGIGLSENQF